jgi:putative nucleotidyltransferase with HDIG domain
VDIKVIKWIEKTSSPSPCRGITQAIMSVQGIDYEVIVDSLKGKLPSLPVVMNELMTVISDHDAALYALQDLLKMDHSIFAQLLKVANTHEYRQGKEKRITTMDEAVNTLGLEKVKRVALNTTILSLYKGVELPVDFSLEALWMHSVGVALASSSLAEHLHTDLVDQAYTCGLLHDIGKVAKCKFDQILFCEEITSANENNLDTHQWEIAGEHIRHDILGSYLARTWGISPMVETVTKWHHEEDRSKRHDIEDANIQKLIDIVYLANGTIHRLEFGNSGHRHVKEPSKLILRRLRLDEEEFSEFEEKLVKNLEEEEESFILFATG